MCSRLKVDEQYMINSMINFAEGRIATTDFWELLSQGIYELLVNDEYRAEWQKKYDYPKYFFSRYNSEKLYDRAELHSIVTMYLTRRKIPFTPLNKDVEMSVLFSKIQPNWLEIQDDKFLLEILNSAPANISKNEKLKYGKDRIKELFRYDYKPPKWIQNPEWPIINGIPLVFRRQEEDKENNSKVYYYFYDAKTNAETVIEQFD